MQATNTPKTSRIKTPSRITVIRDSEKSWFSLATGELVIGTRLPLGGEDVIEIALPSDAEVVVGEFCVKLCVFIVGVCVVVDSPLVGLVGIVEERHLLLEDRLPVQCTVIVAIHESSSWKGKSRTVHWVGSRLLSL